MTIGIPSVYNAKQWLEILRRGTMQFDLYYRLLHEEMARCGQTLEDVGSSEAEMREILVRCCKVHCNYLLNFLRDREIVTREVFIRWIREDLSRSGLTPEDIGTSEEELSRLLISRV